MWVRRTLTVLRDAVEVFWIRGDEQAAMEVYARVRQVQSDRWRQVEARHGKISHYFDPFGQIKPQYRRDALPVVKEPEPSMVSLLPLLVLLLVAVMVVVWWLW
jgi:hypothetical protein